MKKSLIITSIIIVLCVAFRFATTKFAEIARGKQMQAAAVPTVELDEIKEQEIYKSLEIPGRIESVDKVDLVARIDGYLQKKHFVEGDYVKKGQVLFTIEQTQYLNILNEAKAQLQNAKAVLYKAERDYARGAELVKKDYISKSTYDGLYAEKLSAQAAVKSAQAQLSEAQRKYSYTTIKAPTDGKIGSLNIHEGNYVTIANGPIATITKTNPIYVKYSVDSKLFDEMRKDEYIPQKGSDPIKVEIILTSGETYPIQGVQDFWDNQVSNSTGTIDFRATFENNDNILIPGDFVKVKVYSNKKNTVLLVPQEFVLQDSKGRYVYTVNEDNLATPKYFKDNGQYESYWIVKDGLNLGDKYIKTSITTLMPNRKVKIAQTGEKEGQ